MQVRPSAEVRRAVAATLATALACLVAPAATLAQNAYITNFNADTVSVIATATNTVVGSPIPIGNGPTAFGLFIQPAKAKFAGMPGQANCAGKSVSAVTRRYGGLSAAARVLGYDSVAALQDAIRTYCNG
jgi:YVTN family beta-propeller protein